MRAGDLRDRITIEEQAKTADGAGGYTLGAWSAITDGARIPASVEPLSGEERLIADQAQSNVDYNVTCRYRSGVAADQRVTWHLGDGDRTLYITSPPAIVGHREGLTFQAREDVD